MRKLILFLIVPFVFFSCKERGLIVDLDGSNSGGDTTYVGNIETAEPKQMLIEEFTGVSCPPCPSGHDIVKSIKTQYPGRINVIAYHVKGFPQAKPIEGLSIQDFTTQDAKDMGDAFGGLPAMPLAVIERVPKTGSSELFQDQAFWANAVANRASITPPMNIHLTSTYDQVQRIATVKVRLNYTQAFSATHAISLALVEDSVIDAQKNNLVIDTIYVHNYILRDLVTDVTGVPVLPSLATKEAGRVYEKTFTVALNSLWVADKCRIVAFTHSTQAGNKEVYQSAEIHVK